MIDREQILTEAFIRMVYQFLEDKDINGELYIDSIAMSAGENAVEALVALGLATDIPGGRLRARWTEAGMAARGRAGLG